MTLTYDLVIYIVLRMLCRDFFAVLVAYLGVLTKNAILKTTDVLFRIPNHHIL